jgi:hypothetical protein
VKTDLGRKGSWLKIVISLALAGLALVGGGWLLTTPTVAQGGRPSSLELIEGAYLRGELDYETALIYKVYSIFAPDRLPSEFQSDTPSRGATLVLAEVMNAWDSLSLDTRVLLREFGLGLPLPGEVVPLEQTRPTINGEEIYDTTHFRVHYTQLNGDVDEIPSDDDNGNGTPDYLEWVADAVENVWSTEITTMGWLQPPPDAGEGGDTRYDLYLKNCWPYYGYVDPGGGFVGDNPSSSGVIETNAYYSYMVLENDFRLQPSPQNDIKVTVAHEFNHAIQVGYDRAEETWLMESTATWIEDEVYDDINDNYQFLDKLFGEPDLALDTTFTAYTYSRWILMRYISEHYGRATVRRIWEHAVTQDSMDAVDLSLTEAGTNFATLFPCFTAADYVLSDLVPNAPYDYEEADGYKGAISGGAVETEAIIPFDGTPLTYNSYTDGNNRLECRSAEYIEVESTVNFQVTFESQDSTDFGVQGALRYSDGRVTIKQVPLSGGQGTWVVVDPTAYDEVVLIVTNRGDTDETAGYDLHFSTTTETPPTASLTANPISGTVDTVFNFDASGSIDTQTPVGQLEVRWDWDGDWVWDTDWSTTKIASHIYVTSGTYTATVEVRDEVDLRDVAARTVQVSGVEPGPGDFFVYLPVALKSYPSN